MPSLISLEEFNKIRFQFNPEIITPYSKGYVKIYSSLPNSGYVSNVPLVVPIDFILNDAKVSFRINRDMIKKLNSPQLPAIKTHYLYFDSWVPTFNGTPIVFLQDLSDMALACYIGVFGEIQGIRGYNSLKIEYPLDLIRSECINEWKRRYKEKPCGNKAWVKKAHNIASGIDHVVEGLS